MIEGPISFFSWELAQIRYFDDKLFLNDIDHFLENSLVYWIQQITRDYSNWILLRRSLGSFSSLWKTERMVRLSTLFL
eukprot:m.169353 g.169353  ORF g.169353 m.169353 type:complete len:78 (+) comp38985_c0_seq6:518-751(+)